MSSRLGRLWQSLRTEGVGPTAGLIKKNLLHEFRLYLDGSFDRKYGTRTSGVFYLQELDIASENVRHGVYYEPTPTKVFLEVLSGLGIRYEDFAYYDVGSGMGRTLLLASQFPFREIVGIEFSEKLHRRAVENIRVYRDPAQRCSSITSLCLDATRFVPPPRAAVLFFYNPFEGPVMKAVLANIERSCAEHPRKIILIYYNPLWADLIDELGFLPHKRSVPISHDYSRAMQRKVLIYSN